MSRRGNSRIADIRVRTSSIRSKILDYLIAQFIALFSINLIMFLMDMTTGKIIPLDGLIDRNQIGGSYHTQFKVSLLIFF